MSDIMYNNDEFNEHNESSTFELQHPTEEMTLMLVISKVSGPNPYNLVHIFVDPFVWFIFIDSNLNPSIQMLETFPDVADLGFMFDPSFTLNDAFEAGRLVELCDDEYEDMHDRLFEFGVLYEE